MKIKPLNDRVLVLRVQEEQKTNAELIDTLKEENRALAEDGRRCCLPRGDGH